MNPTAFAPPLAGNTIGSINGDFIIAEWQDKGGISEQPRLIAPLHLHHRDDEAWYILEGALHVRSGDQIIEARAGASVFVPRGTPHTYWNPGPDPVRYLLVMTSNIYGLIADIHALPERTPTALAAVFRKHDSELLPA